MLLIALQDVVCVAVYSQPFTSRIVILTTNYRSRRNTFQSCLNIAKTNKHAFLLLSLTKIQIPNVAGNGVGVFRITKDYTPIAAGMSERFREIN